MSRVVFSLTDAQVECLLKVAREKKAQRYDWGCFDGLERAGFVRSKPARLYQDARAELTASGKAAVRLIRILHLQEL
jgi:hypothetical protein